MTENCSWDSWSCKRKRIRNIKKRSKSFKTWSMKNRWMKKRLILMLTLKTRIKIRSKIYHLNQNWCRLGWISNLDRDLRWLNQEAAWLNNNLLGEELQLMVDILQSLKILEFLWFINLWPRSKVKSRKYWDMKELSISSKRWLITSKNKIKPQELNLKEKFPPRLSLNTIWKKQFQKLQRKERRLKKKRTKIEKSVLNFI